MAQFMAFLEERKYLTHQLSILVPDPSTQPLLTMPTKGVTNVKASRPWHAMVTNVPRITQNTFLPDLSMRKPNSGDAIADIMYTRLETHIKHTFISNFTCTDAVCSFVKIAES
ncbi:hypothetical protein MAR_013176 [Mya arenaria]|uniref:Uncharacterized protein n=1 Tax=Mya arenaria TaxID=6604 RepID=A0ABY7FZ63_MYAAR|nr:hypothetical protein MAR_013176 [Mya arenaria]